MGIPVKENFEASNVHGKHVLCSPRLEKKYLDILGNSISESRLPSSLYGDWDEKESSSVSESSSDSLTTSSELSSPVTCVPWTTNASCEGKEKDQALTMGISTNVLLDRKRKERNESWCSQEQETKVIKANEPEGEAVPKGIHGCGKPASGSSCSNSDEVSETAEIESANLTFSTSTDTDEDNAFGKAVPIPQRELGYGMRTMPINFEPETQRQWERTAAQWNSRKTRRTHRPRHSRSSKSFSEVEEVIKKNFRNFEELSISTSSKSSSVSGFEDESLGETVELDLDIIQSSPEEEDSARMSAKTIMAPLPSLDFSTLLHQVESDEPVSYSAAIHSRSDLAMLSPRSSIVLIGDMDPNVAPSPPLRQFLLDPPISKQILNANQDLKMNALSRQISNQKKQLRRLEEEHAKIFGGNLSFADKLKHSEMSKCINHLSRAKRAMKQIREDPSSLRSGSNHAGMRESIRSLSAPVISPKVITPESLKLLESTVSAAERKLQDSRLSQNRPEDLFVMSASELKDEKEAIQKQLILLEKLHGRPERGEKSIVRSLYDRYRALKRITGRATTVKENSLDLVPILEHETLDLSRDDNFIRKPGCSIVELSKGFSGSPKSQRRHLGVVTADDQVEVTSNNLKKNEDFNDMDLKELRDRLSVFESDRHELRGSIRAFESAFAVSNGRVLKKGEKCPGAEVEGLYQQYKHVRATIRLLRILIEKASKLPGLLEDAGKV